MRKVISFVHISLDGFVAGPDGEMDWIKVDQEIFDDVAKRISNTDTAMYGRVTFEMMESYWPTAADQPHPTKHDIEHSKWYKNVRKVVLSKTLKEEDSTQTKIISHHISEQIRELKNESGGDILIFGSPTATKLLLELNLVGGFWLFVNPIVLGKGIRLFEGIENQINLKLLDSHQFSNGVTELNYIVEKP